MSDPSQIISPIVPGQLLQGNPLGDPPARLTPVYLPPGYHHSHQRYPAVYWLTGYTGRGLALLNDSPFDETIQERLDRLISAGQIQPFIMVMPDCFTRYGGSQYINSSATGLYEDYLTQELIPYIDRHFRTQAEPSGRAVAGKSSGGYGAMVLAMRHPHLFGALASHSGDMYFEYCYKPDFPKFLNAADRLSIHSEESLKNFLAAFTPKMHPKPANFFDLISVAAMSACYSPNPAAPCGFDLPFDLSTGELRPEVWQRWLAHDPITLIEDDRYATALRQMKLVYLDCGNRDEYALHYGARILGQRLTRLNISFIFEEFEGSHRHIQFRYDVSLKALSAVFGV
jgi:enterochelin esterase family protein